MLEDQVATFRTLKMQLLLVFLAVEAAYPHRREELTGLLWSEQPEETARANLRLSLHRLRKTLQEDDLALFFQTTRDTVQFNTLSDHWLDVMVFNELIAECQTHDHEQLGSCEACSARLTQAVDLYRGDFLAGISLYDSETFEAWVLMQRETLRQQAFSTLETLIAFHDQRADYPALCRAARRQLELEPWHEAAHRGLMRGLALAGDRDSALSQYETCQRVLEQELGIEPEIQTRTLYERIRAGELSSAQLSAQAPTHNLPTQLTPFVGREGELIEIAGLLKQPDVRLLALVGAGGMGKTRLALEAARAQLDEFKHGVFFVSLAPLSSASALAPAIASALSLELHDDPKAGVLEFLRDKHLLLILDNFEHLLTSPPSPPLLQGEGVGGEVGVGLVVEILGAAPQVQILVTSRERLQVRGEYLYRVEGMDYEIEEAAASSAVRLFVQSARHVSLVNYIAIWGILMRLKNGSRSFWNSCKKLNHEMPKQRDIISLQCLPVIGVSMNRRSHMPCALRTLIVRHTYVLDRPRRS
jgi:DNA-binding SARP family transcriptional activator